MVLRSTRPPEQNKNDEAGNAERRAASEWQFWTFFYFRLTLFALLAPVFVLAVIEVVVSDVPPHRQPLLIKPLFTWLLVSLFAVAGLRFLVLMCVAFIPYIGHIPLVIFDFTILPLLAFVRDVLIETPRMFFARVLQFALTTHTRSLTTGFSVALPFVLFCLVFAAGLLYCKAHLVELSNLIEFPAKK